MFGSASRIAFQLSEGLLLMRGFQWHLYSEAFSLDARAAHGIETWVIPVESGHYGKSTIDSAGFAEAEELLVATRGTQFASTCYLPPEVYRYREIEAMPGFHVTY